MSAARSGMGSVRRDLGSARGAVRGRRSDWVGREAAPRWRLAPDRPTLAALLLGLLLAGLALSALRVDLIRVRYALAEAMQQEASLREQHRALRARVQELRAPDRLAEVASQRGLARPERVLELPTGEPGR